MEVNLGYRASTRQSWKKKNVRDLVLSIIWENPAASRKDLVRLVVERLREDDEYLVNAGEYIVDLGQESLDRYERNRKCREPAAKAAQKQKAHEALESVKRKIMWLNEIMPNGKRYRFNKGTEMVEQGNEATKNGVKWIKIGKRVGNKMVGEVLSEEQVRKIMEG